MLKTRLPPRLTPLAASFGLKPFYGDLHNHCALSYGHGSPGLALARAKLQLDFVSVTGHAAWPDMPVDDPSVAHIVAFHVEGFSRLKRLWPGHFETLRAFHEPGAFTVFPGYEIHSFAHGDYTILYRDLAAREMVLTDSPAELRVALEARHPGVAMAFPHHLGYRPGARGVNWDVLDPRLSPVLEIMSMHGCSETSLTDRPFLHSMGPSDGRSTMRRGLQLGHVFGVLGNTDHHSGFPGSYGHGRSCVYARENTTDALWSALWARRTGALTGDCAHLFCAFNGVAQGGIATPGSGALDIEAVGGGAIDYIDVIRGGALFERITPELRAGPIEAASPSGAFETIVTLELGWGARGKSHRWTGRLAIRDAEILAVEPRLRGPEIVSPLEGAAEENDIDRVEASVSEVAFDIRAHANPNNMTPSMQAIALRVRATPRARIVGEFCGAKIETTLARLMEGALAGNIGPIDSPAWRLLPAPTPAQWQWRGAIPLGDVSDGENVYLRMRQANQQWAWSSPIFFRDNG